MIDDCPVCNTQLADPFFQFSQVPLFCNVQYPDPCSAKEAERGDIKLALCPECDLIVNRDFDSNSLKYDPSYENALHFSSVFRDYLDQLAQRLADKFSLLDKAIIEIGAGDGFFLDLLCRQGRNTGVGFDPANSTSQANTISSRLQMNQGEYDPARMEQPVDLLVCRHVLEHLPQPLPLLRSIINKSVLKPTGAIYLEVPNFRHTLEFIGVWDIIYEHCLYFSKSSMRALLSKIDVSNADLHEVFGGQFLSAEVDLSIADNNVLSEDKQDLKLLTERFATVWLNRLSGLQSMLEDLYQSGCCIAIWGAGSKGITFNNVVANNNAIKAFIDINVRKQKMFAPGTGLPILPPESIKELGVDTILVMNANYQKEIENLLLDLSINAKCIVI